VRSDSGPVLLGFVHAVLLVFLGDRLCVVVGVPDGVWQDILVGVVRITVPLLLLLRIVSIR
jgi:ABC-type proline/glycine betaine transport system permease subunit